MDTVLFFLDNNLSGGKILLDNAWRNLSPEDQMEADYDRWVQENPTHTNESEQTMPIQGSDD